MKTALKYGAILIGAYLVVYYGTGAGKVIHTGAAGAVSIAKALQGRT